MARRSRPGPYRIEFSPAAARQLRKLPPDVRKRVGTKIDALASDPRPPGTEKLEGQDGLLRVRAGDYRIVYTVADDVILVVIVKIGHRADIYKALRKRR
jgi:mRNA interferase RelE/StbE